MAAVTSDILLKDFCHVKGYSTHQIAQGKQKSHTTNQPPYITDQISIVQYHSDLGKIVNANPQFSLLLSSWDSSKNPFFHGSCAYITQYDELYITSDLLQPTDPAQTPIILISRVKLLRISDPGLDNGEIRSVVWSKLRPPPNMPMPAGAVPLTHSKDRRGVVYCSQGNLTSAPGGVFRMMIGKPPEPVVTNWMGTEFGCVCSVAVDDHKMAHWFVDGGSRGFEAGFRGRPRLPAAVWRYSLVDGVRMMTDDVHSPWGIALSPDGETVYITDAARVKDGTGAVEVEDNISAGIYAFDVITRSGAPFLTGKRLFARAGKGIPKGVICDAKGNVFAGCGDGVEIWNPGGLLLGVISVPSPVTSLGWGRDDELFICAGQTLWLLRYGTFTQHFTSDPGAFHTLEVASPQPQH